MNEMNNLFDQLQLAIERASNKLLETHQKIRQAPSSWTEEDQEELLEVLTSRFARLSDLYTQKLLNFYFKLLQEPDLSFIDKCQRLEKLGILPDAKLLYAIRSLRNQIAHEYAEDHLDAIHKEVLENTPILIEMIKATLRSIADNQKKLS